MNMSQRASQMLKQWAILGGLLIVLHVFLFIGWVIIEPYVRDSSTPILVLTVIYLVLFAVIGWWFYKRLVEADSPIEYREAEEHGLSATAKVLDIKRTKWRIKRSRNFKLQGRPTRFEYEMRVRVSLDGQPDYEAMVADFLVGDQVPKKGDVIPIKVHPERPEVIVMVIQKSKDYD
jgi:hypothetical protein